MSELFWLLGWGMAVIVGITVLRERRPPTATIAWLLLLFALPYVGALLYVLIGARKVGRPRQLNLHVDHAVLPLEAAHPLDKMLRRVGVVGATSDNVVRLLAGAKDARQALLETIAKANQRLFVLVYDFNCDAAGLEVAQALIEAARRGVTVRWMVDDIGSRFLCSETAEEFKRHGGVIVRFKPVWFSMIKRIANLRNHRKIVVADSYYAWAGGRNVGNCYLADFAENAWADLSFALEGSAAAVLEEICRRDWEAATEETLSLPQLNKPDEEPPPGNSSVQVLASGPDQRTDVWHLSFIKACFQAQNRIWIMTPYFVPEEAVLNAIAIAAVSGLDVRIVVPEKSDNFLVDIVAASYLRELSRRGVKVSRYNSGMLHAKAVLIDDDITLIGSANVDARSFFLNYEVMALFYDKAVAAELEKYFEFVSTRSENGMKAVSTGRETLAGCARIFSPML